MRRLVFAALSSALVLSACDDPAEDIREAREELREIEREYAEELNRARTEVRRKQIEAGRADEELRKLIREGEMEVREAERDYRAAQTAAAREHQKAQQGLRRDLHKQEVRIRELREKSANDSPELASRLEAFLNPVEKHLTEARNRIMAFEEYTYPDWSELKESAQQSIERLEESIDRAEDYRDLGAPVPRAIPIPDNTAETRL
jgi:DNA-binding transcriptional regulator YiaG